MSFPNANPPPPPPPPLLPLPFSGGDVAGLWGQYCMNPEHSYSHSQHEIVPPFKRLRNSEYNPPNSRLLSPMNPMIDPPNLLGDKGTSHVFYKTRLCARFLRGTCENGELCRYAHGLEDLREPAPNWQEHVREKDWESGNWNDEERFIRRMKICKRYYNGGMCPYGEKCTFLHERSMKFRTDMARQSKSSAISIGTTGPIMRSRSDDKQLENKHVNANSEAFRVKPVFWKTKICIKWEMTGHCPFGEMCHFAHGQSELQVPHSHIESEPVVQSSAIQIEPLSIPETDSTPANVVACATNKEEKEDKKISKWKLTKKISGIYADWIDGFMPPHDLPSNEEI